jgi:hypothetical protein
MTLGLEEAGVRVKSLPAAEFSCLTPVRFKIQ